MPRFILTPPIRLHSVVLKYDETLFFPYHLLKISRNKHITVKGPIHDQSCCAKMFCATEVCPFTINHVAQHKFAHSRSIMLRKNGLCNTSLPIHDQSCCAKMFCATQVCTTYDSIHVATWLHNFS
jgi:hypothetical protein